MPNLPTLAISLDAPTDFESVALIAVLFRLMPEKLADIDSTPAVHA
jgi:hypothetical protein